MSPQHKIATVIQHKVGTVHVADTLAAGSAVGFGYQLMTQLDLVVSILAGLLVATSAGLSIYLHWQEHKRRKKEEEQREENSD